MKKLCLYILVCGFMLPLLHAGDVLYKHIQQQGPVSKGGQFYSPRLNYPQTELETVGSHGINAGNWHRVQSGLAFLSAADLRLSKNHLSFNSNVSGKDNLSFKEYLFHIYPSHNFW
jgi:hypothetical protein